MYVLAVEFFAGCPNPSDAEKIANAKILASNLSDIIFTPPRKYRFLSPNGRRDIVRAFDLPKGAL